MHEIEKCVEGNGNRYDRMHETRVPTVTIVMSVFNQGPLLRTAVQSIMQQTWQDWELLLIDDGSTDTAIDAISDLFDDRVRVIRDGVNRGLAIRLNQGIDLARGCYIARMDGDDISYPERLRRQVEYLNANQDVDLLGTRAIAISEDNRLLGALPFEQTHDKICAVPWRSFYLAHPTWMGKASWFKLHRYASPAPYLCEDQELLLRAHEVSNYQALPETLFAYRLRCQTPMRKALKTRLALFGVQRTYFGRKRQYGAVIFALAGLLARLLLDLGNAIVSSLGMGHYRRQTSGELQGQEEASKLHNVLQSLGD